MLTGFNAKVEVVRINSSFANGRLSAVDRRAFLTRPFEHQAALIGEYAKNQLAKVNNVISETFASRIPDGTPTAVQLWEGMIASTVRTSEANKITALCSGLQVQSANIAQMLSDCYTFWVNEFYSCDDDGDMGTTPAQFSPAIRFTDDQMALIDSMSGMRSLGLNLRGYANFLYMTAD